MKKKEKHIYLLAFLLLSACSASEEIQKFPVLENKYDPSRPKEVRVIKPTTGRIDDNFVIEGNLGTDINKMKVYFGEKQGLLLKTNGQSLHGIVPKQPDGNNRITVVLDEDSLVTDLEFRYRQNQYVVTVTGKKEEMSGWGGEYSGDCKDGSLGEATFSFLRGITIVAGGNILVNSTKNSMTLVSLEDEKVATIYGFWGHPFGEGAVPSSGEEAYFIHKDNRRVFKATRTGGWVPIQVRAETPELTGAVTTATFGPDDRYFYTRDQYGNFGRFDTQSEGLPFEKLADIEYGGKDELRMCYCRYSDCFYTIFPDQHGVLKIWQDKASGEWKSERYAGFNGAGKAEGHRLREAQFNDPLGIGVDEDGNVYVGNYGNSIIQKIWLKSGRVEHVAGVPHASWETRTVINGKPMDSWFYCPSSIRQDADGNFMISEFEGGQIRKYAIE